MKRILALAVWLVVICSADAQTVIERYTGVWYCTVAPVPAARTSGQLDVYIYDNGLVRIVGLLDGQPAGEGYGTWTSSIRNPTVKTVTFTDPDGWRYTGKAKLGFLSGTFVQPTARLFRGKFQGTQR